MTGPIGIFDSGFGGLTVLKEIQRVLPGYKYIYLGDNARAPYGNRSFNTIYELTRQGVDALFSLGCPLVILACNTASAKALRTIQQNYLPRTTDPSRRVLGVIRPTAEAVGKMTRTGHIGVLGTKGTIDSHTYDIEVSHLFPHVHTHSQACPMWVPLIENNLFDNPGADFFIENDINSLLEQNHAIDTIVLGCTHYPIIANRIKTKLPEGVNIVNQPEIVADSLKDYLNRHPEMERRLAPADTDNTEENTIFYTTENPTHFDGMAELLLNRPIKARQIKLA